MKLSC